MTTSSNPPAKTPARDLGAPAVIIQWTEKGNVRRQIECLRVRQIAISETMLFVLEGEKILGWVYLADIRALHVESRRSYKHPFMGAALALAMIIAPIAVVLSDPNNLGKSFGGDFFLIWGPLLVGFGLLTLYESVFSRKRPWLIVDTATTQQAFMFTEPLTPQESAFLEALAPAAPPTT